MKQNHFSKKKLPGSKWTALDPQQREKHFWVLAWVQHQPEDPLETLELEAVLTRRRLELNYRELKDASRWRMGWH